MNAIMEKIVFYLSVGVFLLTLAIICITCFQFMADYATQSRLSEVETGLGTDITDLKTNLKTDIADLKTDIADLKTDYRHDLQDFQMQILAHLDAKFSNSEERLTSKMIDHLSTAHVNKP